MLEGITRQRNKVKKSRKREGDWCKEAGKGFIDKDR